MIRMWDFWSRNWIGQKEGKILSAKQHDVEKDGVSAIRISNKIDWASEFDKQ